jgi:nitroreductase
MDLEQLIKSRRTVHDFETRAVPPEVIRKAFELSVWAPNHKLTCPWAYYFFSKQDQAIRQQLGAISLEYKIKKNPNLATNEALKSQEVQKFCEIPELVLLLQKSTADSKQEFEDYAAVACGVHNIGLHLWQAGVGSKWSTGPVTKDVRVFELAKVNPVEYVSRGWLWIGYPQKTPPAQPRQLFEVARGFFRTERGGSV